MVISKKININLKIIININKTKNIINNIMHSKKTIYTHLVEDKHNIGST